MSNWKEYLYVNPRNRILREAIKVKDDENSPLTLLFKELDGNMDFGLKRIEIDRGTGKELPPYEQFQSIASEAKLRDFINKNKNRFETLGYKIDNKTVQGNKVVFNKK